MRTRWKLMLSLSCGVILTVTAAWITACIAQMRTCRTIWYGAIAEGTSLHSYTRWDHPAAVITHRRTTVHDAQSIDDKLAYAHESMQSLATPAKKTDRVPPLDVLRSDDPSHYSAVQLERFRDEPQCIVLESGFPMHCMWLRPVALGPGVGRYEYGIDVFPNFLLRWLGASTATLPVMPLAAPFAINVLFWSLLSALLLTSVSRARLWIRKRQKRCTNCGYPLPESSVCPECGTGAVGTPQR